MKPPPYEIVARAGLTKRTGVDRQKRRSIRRCRRMVEALGVGASGEVRQHGVERPVYQCYATEEQGRVVLTVDEL